MKPFNFEPHRAGQNKANNAKTSVKETIKVILQPRRGRKRMLGLAFIVAGYSWFLIQKDDPILTTEPVAQNRLIPLKNKDMDYSSLNDNPTARNSVENFTNFPIKTLAISTEKIDAQKTPPTIEKERIFHTIKRGESLGTIIKDYNFSPNLPFKIVNTEKGKLFTKIRAGKQLEFVLNKDTHELEEIRYPHSELSQLVANVTDDVEVNIEEIEYEIANASASGTINHSLFGAASEAGISDNMIMELAEIFGWDIDFVKDIRKDDSFKLIFEKYMSEDNLLKEGNIIAAEFTNNGQKFTAIRHIDAKGNVGYYAPDGSSMKGTFLKSPMKFSRISSGFSLKRFHPILKKWRAHKGVDYAARTGAPIRSVANGKVIHRGTKGGYGRTLIISHGGKYTTLYAHMSKYNSKVKHGQHVKQGQIIGYVGSSGLATGPHLHYEFRVNGVHRNPLTYKTPKASSITKSERTEFEKNLALQITALNNIQSDQESSNLLAQAINILNNSDNSESQNSIEAALK